MIREVELDKDRMTLGRKPDNDIVIAHLAVSGVHAAFTLLMDDVFLEDLGSTNGTYVNGKRIAKHMLEDHDNIVIARFQVEFRAGPRHVPVIADPARQLEGSIEVKNGPNAGRKLALVKPVSTLGKPGVQVVVITRENNAFFLTHIDGARAPRVNGVATGRTAKRLAHGDMLELEDVLMVFSCS